MLLYSRLRISHLGVKDDHLMLDGTNPSSTLGSKLAIGHQEAS